MLVLFIFLLNGTFFESVPYPFLFPWLVALLVVLVTPTAILFYQGKLRLENPIVFATGPILSRHSSSAVVALAAGWSKPYYVHSFRTPTTTCRIRSGSSCSGFAGLSIGYFLPVGRKVGAVSRPVSFQRPTTAVVIYDPGSCFSFWVSSIRSRPLHWDSRFSKGRRDQFYDGLIFLTTLFWMQASFILWYVIFSQRRFTQRLSS